MTQLEKVVIPIDTMLFTLTILLATLKLTGHITWSWWWVTCPLWAPFAFLGVLMGMLFLFGFTALAVFVIVEIINHIRK